MTNLSGIFCFQVIDSDLIISQHSASLVFTEMSRRFMIIFHLKTKIVASIIPLEQTQKNTVLFGPIQNTCVQRGSPSSFVHKNLQYKAVSELLPIQL